MTFLDPTPIGLAVQAGSFAAVDFSGLVAPDTIIVGGRFGHLNTPVDAPQEGYLRNKASTDSGSLDINRGSATQRNYQHLHVKVDDILRAEYTKESAQMDFEIQWYELPPLPTAGFARVRLLDDDKAPSASIGSVPNVTALRVSERLSLSTRLETPNV